MVLTERRYVPHSRSYTDVLRPVFEDHIISRRGDVVWPPWSCDKVHEAIGEIQLLTIDNVLKNWTDREGNCMACRGNYLNEIIFRY